MSLSASSFPAPLPWALRSRNGNLMDVKTTVAPTTTTTTTIIETSRILPVFSGKHEFKLKLIGNTKLVKKLQNLKYNPNSNYEDTDLVSIVYYVKRTINNEPYVWIGAFYSRIQNDVDFIELLSTYGTAEEKNLLKSGIGYSALCFLVNHLLNQTKQLQLDSWIALEASGRKITSPGQEQELLDPGLIPYYLKLGFRFPTPPARFYVYLNSSKPSIDRISDIVGPNYTGSWQDFFKKAFFVPLATQVKTFLELCERQKRHVFIS